MRPKSPKNLLNPAVFSCLAALGLGASFSTGCSESGPESADSASEEVQQYTVRGEIVALPDAADPASSLRIRHEAITEFKSEDGTVVGMDPMVMSFPLADGLDLGGFEEGNKVELTFAVQWSGENRGWEATDMKKLADDMPLNFDKPAASGSADVHTDERTGHNHEDHSGHDH